MIRFSIRKFRCLHKRAAVAIVLSIVHGPLPNWTLSFWRPLSEFDVLALLLLLSWLLFHRSISIFVKLMSNLKIPSEVYFGFVVFISNKIDFLTCVMSFSKNIVEIRHWMVDPTFQSVHWSSVTRFQTLAQIHRACDPFPSPIRPSFLLHGNEAKNIEVRVIITWKIFAVTTGNFGFGINHVLSLSFFINFRPILLIHTYITQLYIYIQLSLSKFIYKSQHYAHSMTFQFANF